MEDLKGKIEEIVKKVNTDKSFSLFFKNDPVKAIESVLNIDLPDEKVNEIINAVKAKIAVKQSKGILDKVKGLFSK